MSLLSDGSTVAVSALMYNGESGNEAGSVRVYTTDTSSPIGWSQIAIFCGEASHKRFGWSLSLSGNGNWAIAVWLEEFH